MTVFINACVRRESRTRRLAQRLLDRLGSYCEVDLNTAGLHPLTGEELEERAARIAASDFESPMFALARQFAKADTIVIAAPFWDYAFPAVLKTYLENIYVTGIVSRYGSDGRPVGLCRARKLFYVTTAGGPYLPDYSYTYIRQLACTCFGIKETYLIRAEMLDVDGFDAETILRAEEAEIDRLPPSVFQS